MHPRATCCGFRARMGLRWVVLRVDRSLASYYPYHGFGWRPVSGLPKRSWKLRSPSSDASQILYDCLSDPLTCLRLRPLILLSPTQPWSISWTLGVSSFHDVRPRAFHTGWQLENFGGDAERYRARSRRVPPLRIRRSPLVARPAPTSICSVTPHS